MSLFGGEGEIVGREELVQEGDSELQTMRSHRAVSSDIVIKVEFLQNPTRISVCFFRCRCLVEVDVSLTQFICPFT